MNEEHMHRLLMIAGMTLAVLAGLGAVAILALTALDFTWSGLVGSLLLGGAAIGCAWTASFYGAQVSGPTKVFTNAAEQEVLTLRQQRELRRARGEVVLERALIEIEHERQNIVHRQIEDSDDDSTPPYETSWTQRMKEIEAGREKGPKARQQRSDEWD